MLIIYSIPISLYCAKLRIVLRHKELTWREVLPPGGYGSDDYKRIVPSGNLPALVDGEVMIADSEAIAEYLEERHPIPAMLPVNPMERAKVRERSRFHDTRLEPEVRALFPFLPGREVITEETLCKQSRELSKRLEQLAHMVDEAFRPESTLSLADSGFAITFTWLDELIPLMGLDISWPKPVAVYRKWLENQCAVKEELTEYGPKLATFLTG